MFELILSKEILSVLFLAVGVIGAICVSAILMERKQPRAKQRRAAHPHPKQARFF